MPTCLLNIKKIIFYIGFIYFVCAYEYGHQRTPCGVDSFPPLFGCLGVKSNKSSGLQPGFLVSLSAKSDFLFGDGSQIA